MASVNSKFTIAPELLGDYNDDGSVDAADYVVWRKNELANNPLPNDNGVGNQAARFSLWKANFGNTAPGAGSGAGNGVDDQTQQLVAVSESGGAVLESS